MTELTSIEKLEEIKRDADELRGRIETITRDLDFPALDRDVRDLTKQLEDPNIWNNPQEAGKLNKRLTILKDKRQTWENLLNAAVDAGEFAEIALMEDDPGSYLSDAGKSFRDVLEGVEKEETKLLLSEPEDPGDSICSIQSGAGGTDAQDWAEM
ncbi:PCRF domain-containing protein, partial [bacterium]|nr:PCRF domain-containing protein [bacterium]